MRVGVVSTGEGGDTPGVNAAIRAVVRSIIKKGGEAWVVEEGFYGLLDVAGRKIKRVDRSYVAGILETVCSTHCSTQYHILPFLH